MVNVRHNRKSSERHYQKFITNVDNRPVGVRRLFCATPGCGQQGEIFDRTKDGLPTAFVERKFSEKGWEVGANEKHDFCPKCVAARRAERRSRRVKPIAQPKPVAQESAPMLNVNGVTSIPPAVSETAPAEMSRSDRRVIFAQLEECYADETSGYKTPWTDAGVAKHLGVPQAWVATVREENFGPAQDNQEIRDLLARGAAAAKEAQSLLNDAKAISQEVRALVERVNEHSKRCTEVGKSLAGLIAIGDRIERSLKA